MVGFSLFFIFLQRILIELSEFTRFYRMKYLVATFEITVAADLMQTCRDLLADAAAEAGFESFEDQDSGLEAYVQKELFDKEALNEAIADFPIADARITYQVREAEDKDWNEEWERNFYDPLVVDDRCVVHCTFHKDIPSAEYDIVIDPRMSFGTGHHATTRGMMRYLLEMDIRDKRVLDMGCGTGILAILARMRGAADVLAIDNDEWCVSNSIENLKLNHVEGITVELGDATTLKGRGSFELIIANINRNILLQDMACYAENLAVGGDLLLSGFYVEDIPVINATAASLGLRLEGARQENNWAALHYTKH